MIACVAFVVSFFANLFFLSPSSGASGALCFVILTFPVYLHLYSPICEHVHCLKEGFQYNIKIKKKDKTEWQTVQILMTSSGVTPFAQVSVLVCRAKWVHWFSVTDQNNPLFDINFINNLAGHLGI